MDSHLSDACLAHQSVAHVLEDELRSGAAHRSEGEIDLDHAVSLLDRVDQAEVDEVHGHLGVLHLGERVPETLRHDPFLWCVLRNLWNSSWNIATLSMLRGPRARQRTRTSSQLLGCPKSHRFSSASNSHGNG